MNEQSKKIYKFIRWYLPDVLGIFFGACNAFGAVGIMIPQEGLEQTPEEYIELMAPVGIMMAALALLCFWLGMRGRIKIKRRLRKMQEDPEYDRLCDDFERGTPYMNGKFLIGQAFIIGAKSNFFCRISDVTELYIRHMHNEGYDMQIIVVRVNGKKKQIGRFRVPAYTKAKDPVPARDEMIARLLQCNPGIEIKYQNRY